MAIVINGSGTLSGLAVGGLPDGTVDAGTLATNSVDSAELIDGAIDGSHLASGVGTGLAEADNWRLTTSFTGDADPIASNWERVDTAGQNKLGTGMTQSSGIFTFPSTGIWSIHFEIQNASTALTLWVAATVQMTQNNSSYVTLLSSYPSIFNSDPSWVYVKNQVQTLVDITNTSTHKVRFHINVDGGASAQTTGSSTENKTNVIFTRLGDT